MADSKVANTVPQQPEHQLDVPSAATGAALPAEPKGDIDTSSQESFPEINEKALVRKLDYKLLPALTLLYLLSFLDRSNVGNARIEGLTTDLGMTGNEYLTSLTLFCTISRSSPSACADAQFSRRLCHLRSALQHRAQALDSARMAADNNVGMGRSEYADGRDTKQGRFLRSSVCSSTIRVWTLY
jgi:hypothetical protein